jgi:drug/metabolite transporter (DMT)-like permease
VLSDPAFGALCGLGAALAWSVTSLLARTLMPHYGSVMINAVRSGLAGVLLLLVVALTEGPGVLTAISATTFAVPPERLWFGVGTAVVASAAWAVSTVMMKTPLNEVAPLTAQAIRLPVASVLLSCTPWARGARTALRAAGRGPLLRIGVLGVITAASSVLFVAGLKYAGVAVGSVCGWSRGLLPAGLFDPRSAEYCQRGSGGVRGWGGPKSKESSTIVSSDFGCIRNGSCRSRAPCDR